MTKKTPAQTAQDFAQALSKPDDRIYVLRLYVTGSTPRSVKAITNIKRICDEYLEGRYDLEVIDIYQKPMLAQGEQILAAPTLIKKLPEPLRKFIGDMSDTEKILLGLDLRPKKDEDSEKGRRKVRRS